MVHTGIVWCSIPDIYNLTSTMKRIQWDKLCPRFQNRSWLICHSYLLLNRNVLMQVRITSCYSIHVYVANTYKIKYVSLFTISAFTTILQKRVRVSEFLTSFRNRKKYDYYNAFDTVTWLHNSPLMNLKIGNTLSNIISPPQFPAHKK